MKCYIGIDPGKAGGVAVIADNGIDCIFPIPLAGKDIDAAMLAAKIYDLSEVYDCVVCIEKVTAMPGQGVTSTFSFGVGFGILLGICAALVLPVHLVTPQAWKKVILAGTTKDKAAAISYVSRAYPGVSLLATARSRKPHDGIADAICIAEYASRTY